MTQRKALGDLDFDSAFEDPDNGWFGHVQAEDPISSRDNADPADLPLDDDPQGLDASGAEDTDRWPAVVLDETPAPPVEESPRTPGRRTFELHEVVAVRRPPVDARANRWADPPPAARPSWESRLSGNGAWDFKVSPSAPRNRSKFVVAAVIVAGVAVAGVMLLVRSPDGTDEPTAVTPLESTAQPAPTTAVGLSIPSAAPLPPGPPEIPPPPPPAPAEEISPPVVTRDYTPPRRNAPDPPTTRTPTTRVQLSATPPPPRPPDRNSSTPGDTRKRHGFGF